MDKQDRTPPPSMIPLFKGGKKEKREKNKRAKEEQKYSGEFKHRGVLCPNCRSISPFKYIRCKKCKAKLKVTPRSTGYSNGVVDAILCPKCGEFTDLKGIKCDFCDKKLKF